MTGKIRVYLNVGTETDPCFADYFYAKSNGQDLTVTPEGCLGCSPRLVPWSGVGHKDLLVGLGDGTVKVFLNIGSDQRTVVRWRHDDQGGRHLLECSRRRVAGDARPCRLEQ